VSALVERECVGAASSQVKSNLRLRGMTSRGFACVLAGVTRNKLCAAAGPTTAECISHAKSIDQIVRTLDGAAAAAHVRGG
jgi:hypothetical protein